MEVWGYGHIMTEQVSTLPIPTGETADMLGTKINADPNDSSNYSKIVDLVAGQALP